ncbi:hypothetical protein [Xanthomonas sp. 1678]|uniref:hypothetical protein n=1 Tax=Xanthomonas sp. 1678 TaxID=3158788 RepID=UPI00285EB1A3|nr:hypothetical protein [Xanthomonas translucens]MEB1530787.1 hypothetical protein [Xanthomonas campestris pv. campestris]
MSQCLSVSTDTVRVRATADIDCDQLRPTYWPAVQALDEAAAAPVGAIGLATDRRERQIGLPPHAGRRFQSEAVRALFAFGVATSTAR